MTASPAQPTHPAPHRDRASGWLLWTCLFGPPTAFFLLLGLDSVLASLACFPRDTPLQAPRLDVAPVVIGADIVVLVLTVLAGLAAWRNWRHTAGEKPGGGHKLLGSGDGRTRFMAMSGVLTSGILCLATAYALASHWTLGWCGT